jgi:gamma-glutamylaminecyclotransferase
MTRLFVYGSLLAGEPNDRALEGGYFVGRAQTAARYSLFDLGAYPAMTVDGEHSIAGELYDVDDAVLARLDRLEGHPHFYVRQPIVLADGEIVESYLLAQTHIAGAPLISHGDWRRRRGDKRR